MAKQQKHRTQRNKKSIIPTIAIILLILLLLLAVALFVIFFKPSQPRNDGPLDIPANLQVTKEVSGDDTRYFATFDEVEGADKYIIHIDSTYTQHSRATVVDITKYITEAREYQIGVQAIDNVISSYNSDIAYIDYKNYKQLDTPQVVLDNTVAYWNDISNATNYELTIGYGNTTDTEIITENSYDLYSILQATSNDPTITVFSVVVTAVYEGELLWQDSNPSTEVRYILTKTLDKPVITYNALDAEDGLHHTISWEQVNGAECYELYINNEKVFANITPDTTSVDVTSYINLVGDYEFYLRAISYQENVLPSTSDVLEKTFTYKLATPINVNAVAAQDNISISWDMGDGLGLQTHFLIQIRNEDGTVVYDATIKGLSCQVPLYCNPSGYYSITVIAQHETMPNYYIQSDESEPFILEVSPQLNYPTDVVFTQVRPDAVANLSWTSVPNATGYRIKIYKIVNNEEVVLHTIDQTSNILQFPITEAGFYYAQIMSLSTGSTFYQNSNYGDITECKFVSYLGTVSNIRMSDDGTTLSWDAVPNASSYEVSINGIIVNGLVFSGASAINMDQIFADVEQYPSNKNIPYTIAVRACGEENGAYASGEWGYLQYYLIRVLDAPTNLVYVQEDGSNNATLSWDPVENATNGYMIRINGSSPIALQQYQDTTCEIGQYLIPGFNTLEVSAVSTDNYDASEFTKLDLQRYTYYMQGVADTFSIEATVNKEKVSYVGRFTPNRFANVYTFRFYKTNDNVPAGETVVTAIDSSNVVYSFDINPDWIKSYGDCITNITIISTYDDSLGTTKYDSSFIIGDDGTSTLTEQTTYTNSGILASVIDSDIIVTSVDVFNREIEWTYPTIYLSNVAQFDVNILCTKSTEIISRSASVVVTDFDATSEVTTFSTVFEDLPVGIYQVSIRAVSNSVNLASSAWANSEFVLTVNQEAPENVLIDTNEYGNMYIQWDIIPTHHNYTNYYVVFWLDGQQAPVRTWTAASYNGDTIIRDEVSVRVGKITLDDTTMSSLKSGQYYATVMANNYGPIDSTASPVEYYYKESPISTSLNYAYTATISAPELMISQNSNGDYLLNVKSMGDAVTFSIYYGTTEETSIMNEIPTGNGFQPVRSYINGVAYFSYSLKEFFNDDIIANKYYLSAKAHKIIQGEEVISNFATPVNFDHTKQFSRPEIFTSTQVYEYVNSEDVGTIEFEFSKVVAVQNEGQETEKTVVAGGYEINLQYARETIQNYIILPDGNGGFTITNGNVVLTPNETPIANYTPETIYETELKRWYYYNNGVMWFELIEFENSYIFKLFTTAMETGTIFTENQNYSATILAKENVEDYYNASETNATSFNYRGRYKPPITSFDTADNTEKYKETNGLSAKANLIVQQDNNLDVGQEILTFTVYAENLLTETVTSVTGIGTTADKGRLFEIMAGNYPGLMPTEGLYKITVRYDSTLTKMESRASDPLYIYHGINQDAPAIVQISKEAVAGQSQENARISFVYNGFPNENGIFDDIYSFRFEVSAVDVNDRTTVIGTPYTIDVPANEAGYDAETNMFTYVLNTRYINDFAWIPTDGNVTFHYRFNIIALAYVTDIADIYIQENFTDEYVPTLSDLYDDANKTYKFNQNSEAGTMLIRRDQKLDTPTNITFDAENARITWDPVVDQNGASVHYGVMYYTYGINQTYTWYNRNNSGETITFDTTDNRFETSAGIAIDESIENGYYILVGTNNYISVADIFDDAWPMIFGVWIYAYPVMEEGQSSTSGPSDIGFGTAHYSKQFVMPTQVEIEMIRNDIYEGETYTGYRAIWSNQNIINQIVPGSVTDYNLYKEEFQKIYTLNLGGYEFSNYVDSEVSNANDTNKYSMRITPAYLSNLLIEKSKGSRKYDWILTANDYSYTVYTNAGAQVSHVLYTSNSTSGICYRPIEISRDVIVQSVDTTQSPNYTVTFQAKEYATIYEIRLLNASDNTEISLSNYINGVYPAQGGTSLLTITYDEDEQGNIFYRRSYNEYNGTPISDDVTWYTDSDGITWITCDFAPLLTGLYADEYKINVYATNDPLRYVFVTGDKITNNNTLSFRYTKAFEGISNAYATYNDEGLIQTISWDVAIDADGNYVHETAMFDMVVYSKKSGDENNPEYLTFDNGSRYVYWVNDISSVTGVTPVKELTVQEIMNENGELVQRVVIDVADLFTRYISVGEQYYAGFIVRPLNQSTSAFQPSELVEVLFDHRIKLELEDEGTDYVQFLVDTYLDTSNLENDRTVKFTDSNAEIYLDSVNGQYNIKSIEVLNWISNSDSFRLYKKVNGEWIDVDSTRTIYTTDRITRLDGFLDYGVNTLALQALGINEFYVQSDLKEFTVTIYEQYQKPTISSVIWDTADDGITIENLNIYLDERTVDASKDYGVVIYCYRVVNGVNYLVWQTSDQDMSTPYDDEDRLVWTYSEGRAILADKEGREVNFMDYFKKFCYYDFNDINEVNDLHMIGAFEYKFSARIMAYKEKASDTYRLNSEESDLMPATNFAYTYKLKTPELALTDNNTVEDVQKGLDYVDVTRDENNNVTSAYVRWVLDNPLFKTQIKYTITVWDGKYKRSEDFRKEVIDRNVVRYSAIVNIDYEEDLNPIYSISSVTRQDYAQSTPSLIDQISNYFVLEKIGSYTYLRFELLNYITDSENRTDAYEAGIYRFNVQATEALNKAFSGNYVTNNLITASDVAYKDYVNGASDNTNLDYFYEYTHEIPYPIELTNVTVNSNGLLSMTLEDSYATANRILIFVNGTDENIAPYDIETPTKERYTYSTSIAQTLIPGSGNTVQVCIDEVEYYMRGAIIDAVLEFEVWQATLGTLDNFMWNFVVGVHTVSWNMSFNDFYVDDPQLDNGGELDADKVHYKLELLYSPTQITQNIDNNQGMFDALKATSGVEYISINDINGTDIVKFTVDAENYSFNLVNVLLNQPQAQNWVEGAYLRGGWYVIKVSLTTEDANGNKVANYNDGVGWTSPLIKYIASPWELSESGELVGENVIKSTATNVSETAKQTWASQEQKFGLSFTVNLVNGRAPETYTVYYWRDGATTREEVVISGENVQTVGNTVYLELGHVFAGVNLAGVYNFAWTAHALAVNGENIAESSELSYLLSETERQNQGFDKTYGGYGLGHYVRVYAPTLYESLTESSATGCTITWDRNGIPGETQLGFTFNIRNYLSTEGDYYDGMPAPTTGFYYVNGISETNYRYDRVVNSALNMVQRSAGINYVSIQAIPISNNPYYIESNWSALKEYIWDISMSAPLVDIQIINTVPENEEMFDESDTVNVRDYADLGSIRETAENSRTYTNYWNIIINVDENSYITENGQPYAYVELAVYDPVTNNTNNPTYALAHYVLKGRIVNGGDIVIYQKADIGVNAYNSELYNVTGSDARVIGQVVLNDLGELAFNITGFKSYELLPIVVYENVTTIEDPNYSGTKNFADLPQKYKFVINSYEPNEKVRGTQTIYDYDHRLRMIAPTVTDVQWSGSSIKNGTVTYNGTEQPATYITNDRVEDYQLTLTIENVSRNAQNVMLYVYVDQTDGHPYYNSGSNVFEAEFASGVVVNPVTLAEENTLEYELDKMPYRKFIYRDINSQISYSSPDAAYGTITVTINKLDQPNLWEYINNNTPNVLRFAAQAVGINGDDNEFTTWDGNKYIENTTGIDVEVTQVLRYSQSYIGTPYKSTIYRQFEKAEINVWFDPGQAEHIGESTTLIQASQNITNLNEKDVALDPYLYVMQDDFADAMVQHEYEEIKTYGRYEITVSIDGKSLKKEVISHNDDPSKIDDSGLMDVYEVFTRRVADNPARYEFINGQYVEYTMLEGPAIYKLILELLGGDAANEGGVVTIELRAIREAEDKNYWYNQDEENKNSAQINFYLRPKAVDITLETANFDASNPLVVSWSGNLDTDKNELLYPNDLKLSWTQSSSYIKDYSIDVLPNTTDTGSGQNQGTSVWSKLSVDLADPESGWGGTGYASITPVNRFSNWGQTKAGDDVVPEWAIHVEPNPIKSSYIGRSYPSGAGEGSSLANLTVYYLQLKYNIYDNVVLKSRTGQTESGFISNAYEATIDTKTKGASSGKVMSKVSSSDDSVWSDDTNGFEYIGGIRIEAEGYFDGYNLTTRDYVKEGITFSVNYFVQYLNEFLTSVNAYGDRYTVRYKLFYRTENNNNITEAYLDSEWSRTFTYEYYRGVELNFSVSQSGDGMRFYGSGSHVDEIEIFIKQKRSSGGSFSTSYLGSIDLHRGSSSYTEDFSPSNADALSETSKIDADDAINDFTTAFPGYIQGGNNMFTIIGHAGDHANSDKYNLVSYGEGEYEEEFLIPEEYAPTIEVELADLYTINLVQNYGAASVSSVGNGGTEGTWSCCKGDASAEGCSEIKVYEICGHEEGSSSCTIEHEAGCFGKLNGKCGCTKKHLGDLITVAKQHTGSFSGTAYALQQTANYVPVTVGNTIKITVTNAFKLEYLGKVGAVGLKYESRGATQSPIYAKTMNDKIEFDSDGKLTLNYNLTKNGAEILLDTTLQNVYKIADSLATVYCKEGFGSVIDGLSGERDVAGKQVDYISVKPDVELKVGSASPKTEIVGYMAASAKGEVDGTSGVKASMSIGGSSVRTTDYTFSSTKQLSAAYTFDYKYSWVINVRDGTRYSETTTDSEGNSSTRYWWEYVDSTQPGEETQNISMETNVLDEGAGPTYSGSSVTVSTSNYSYPLTKPSGYTWPTLSNSSSENSSHSESFGSKTEEVVKVNEPTISFTFNVTPNELEEGKTDEEQRKSITDTTTYSVINGGNEKHNTIKAFLEELGQNSGMGCDLYGHYIFAPDGRVGTCLVCGDTGLNANASGYVAIKGDYSLVEGVSLKFEGGENWNGCYYNPTLWNQEGHNKDHFYYTVSDVVKCNDCNGSGVTYYQKTDMEGFLGWDAKHRYRINGCEACGGSGQMRVNQLTVHDIVSTDDNFKLGSGIGSYTITAENFYQGKPETCNDVAHVFSVEKQLLGYFYLNSEDVHDYTDSPSNINANLLIPYYKYTYTCACGRESFSYDSINDNASIEKSCTEGHAHIRVRIRSESVSMSSSSSRYYANALCLTCGETLYDEYIGSGLFLPDADRENGIKNMLNSLNSNSSLVAPINDTDWTYTYQYVQYNGEYKYNNENYYKLLAKFGNPIN